jgi:2-polyprenyl-3-methyl-5-hydroxy-6-metoxy-1,4-benzoquinol methylase
MNVVEIDAVRHQLREILAVAQGLSKDDARKQSNYLSASAWRYAITLDQLNLAFGRSLRDTTVLDIGSYPGHIAALLSKCQRAKVTGLTMVTSPEFEDHMHSVGVAVGVCDVERDPFPAADGSIDVVICCELIEHLEGDVHHMLREAKRVVRNDGLLFLTTPNHASMSHRWALIRGRSVYPPLDDPDYPFYAGASVRNPMRHVREFTGDEITTLLSQTGFNSISVATVSPPLGRGTGLSWRGKLATRILRVAQTLVAGSGELLIAVARS